MNQDIRKLVENSESQEYQEPAHFTYNGKTLDEIRKEKERNR